MNILNKHLTSTAVLCAAAFFNCSHLGATSVSYNFAETGWVNSSGTTITLLGSFTGTPEADGDIGSADLTNVVADIIETNAQEQETILASFGNPSGSSGITDFLFDTNANTLTLAGTDSSGDELCLGNSVITGGACGPVGPPPENRNGQQPPPLQALFISAANAALDSSSTATPTFTLVESPSSGSTGPGGATPEPASSLLCGGAFVMASLVMGISRRRFVRSDAR